METSEKEESMSRPSQIRMSSAGTPFSILFTLFLAILLLMVLAIAMVHFRTKAAKEARGAW